jgi:hypothetical protein
VSITTSKHTPGPWRYSEDRGGRWRVFAGAWEIVRAKATHGFRRLPAAEREANARLIAAAPVMLAALCKIVAIKGSTGGHAAMVAEFQFIARSAIAQAEVES